MGKPQPSQSRFEIPATSEDEANGRTAHTGLVFVRVAKRGRATLRHALISLRTGRRWQSRRSAAERSTVLRQVPMLAMQFSNLLTRADDLESSANRVPVCARRPKATL